MKLPVLSTKKWALLLFLATLAVTLIHIQFPQKPNFDEFHYIPSAKQFLALEENQNWEHPPLGKQIMAIGIGIFGDEPLGWRIMSTLFGAATLAGMFYWGVILFGTLEAGLLTAGITFFNQLLYVQSRIGMLDTFMFGFMVWGFVFFTRLWMGGSNGKKARKDLILTGVLMGLATCTKWAAVIPWIAMWILYFATRLFDYWGVEFKAQKKSNATPPLEFYRKGIFGDLTYKDWLLGLGLVPVLAYFVPFLWFLWIDRTPSYGLWDLILMQPKMYDGQLRVVNSHPYMSTWTGWPWMARPIWYAFDKETDGTVRGVLLLGNPLIMWGGLLALAYCAWDWIKARSARSFLIFFFYSVLYFCWAVIPRKVAFYYYYYPAGMILSLAWVQVLEKTAFAQKHKWLRLVFLGAAAAFFFYFFPILAAIQLPGDGFRTYMWFNHWI